MEVGSESWKWKQFSGRKKSNSDYSCNKMSTCRSHKTSTLYSKTHLPSCGAAVVLVVVVVVVVVTGTT